jgi:RNA recognition motif-containing protein
MATKLYVGNLSYDTEEEGLRSLFSQYGEVVSARVITDRDTGRSRGFGFVEFGNEESAQAAMSSLDGVEFEGRNLRVNEANDRGRGNRRY